MRVGAPASKTLMPVNCAILIGGTATTIGTSTNLLVVSIAEDLGLRPIGIFDFTPIVLTAAAVAVPYLWLVMPRLLPAIDTTTRASRRVYDAALHTANGSRGAGKTVAQIEAMSGASVRVGGVLRPRALVKVDDSGLMLQPGDRLLVTGSIEGL